MTSLKIVEGVSSVWHYHLCDEAEDPFRALCGAMVMPTKIPFSYWKGTPPNYHIPESWCHSCDSLRTTIEEKTHNNVMEPETKRKWGKLIGFFFRKSLKEDSNE